MSYGERFRDFNRHAAFYVDKIMKGAKPADLPIQQLTRFFVTINRKTADALGLTIRWNCLCSPTRSSSEAREFSSSRTRRIVGEFCATSSRARTTK